MIDILRSTDLYGGHLLLRITYDKSPKIKHKIMKLKIALILLILFSSVN